MYVILLVLEVFISHLISKLVSGDRLPVILCVSPFSGCSQDVDLSLFNEVYGITIVFPETGQLFDTQHIAHLEKLIVEIKAELKCEHILLVDYHAFQSEERSFRFFSHEQNSDISSVGYFLKGTFRDQAGVVLDESPITSGKTLLDHFKAMDRNIHCYQMAFSSKLLEDEKLTVSTEQSMFKYAVFSSIFAAVTKMRLDAGEFQK